MAGLHSVRLADFLVKAAGEPFSYGTWDCGMTVGNWLVETVGRDPFADLRGRYRTRLGWMRLAAKEGGLVGLVASRLDRLGLQRTDLPRPGDVALVTIPEGPTCAVRSALGYVVKTANGIACAELPLIMAWRVA